MIRRVKIFFWGLFILPLTLATLFHLPAALFSVRSQSDSLLSLSAGIVLYILFETLFNRPMRTYVFGHELTHALATLAAGGRVHAFHVAKDGGHVSLSKTNFFIALAPYCIPIYTVFILLLYFTLKFWLPVSNVQMFFLASVGASMAFHCSLTIFAICQQQPDIEKTGFFFSLVFILLMNGWILILLSKILFWNSFSLKNFFWSTMKTHATVWKWVLEKMTAAAQWLYRTSVA